MLASPGPTAAEAAPAVDRAPPEREEPAAAPDGEETVVAPGAAEAEAPAARAARRPS
jgi:hypothetical protein